MNTLDDSDKMTFGKHRGERLADVPDSYLCYLWNEGLNCETREDNARGALARYIRAALPVIGAKTATKREDER